MTIRIQQFFFRSYGYFRSIVIYYILFPFKQNRMRKFYSQFVDKDKIVFDIGAHIGDRTRIFSDLGAKVVAIEPQEWFYKFLKKRFKKNTNVLIRYEALGATNTKSKMFISFKTPTVSTLSEEFQKAVKKGNSSNWSNVEWNQIVKVRVNTLDNLIVDYSDKKIFCKIDVEGYEYKVLQGLSKQVEALSFEYTSLYIENSIKCIDYLSRLGNYEFNFSKGESFKFDLNKWCSGDTLKKILHNQLSKAERSGDIYVRLKAD